MEFELFVSVEEKEKIFYTELVKYGVSYEKAVIAARILASGQPDELLTDEEILIAKEACSKWFLEKKRDQYIKSLIKDLDSINKSSENFPLNT
ncbi:hypothetical protein [Nostoc sp. LEGE 12450]|uniref:hypothetical protein n=1 Tax=Nostoc sp. LEGE 12450 TaxID=1828643 RepID=UPI00187EDDA4|nr:hypothetical protein [Nostoc sp. LEGE 12450]MBE8990366.1 hypothetical protein [Nostoc sp. LEGE 12450]